MSGDAPPALRFAGYAAIFGKVDRGGDVIAPGAFARSLGRLTRDGAAVPLLWQHDAGQPIGVIERVAEDARGLRVIGCLSPRAGPAARAAQLLRAGAMDGLSFGYRVVAARGQAPRHLDVLDLVEISLVARPMQPLARVHALAP